MAKTEKTTDVTEFAWYERYTKAMEKLPNKTARMVFALALIEYAVYDKEPKFIDMDGCPQWAQEALFEACRTSVKNSKETCERNRRAGKASAEARKARKEAEDVCAKMSAVNSKTDKAWEETDCSDYEVASAVPEYNEWPEEYEDTCPF